jgi:hypothetical protein
VSITSLYCAAMQTPDKLPFLLSESRTMAAINHLRANVGAQPRIDVLLGLREPSLWILAPIFVFVSLGVTILTAWLVYYMILGFTILYTSMTKKPRWQARERRYLYTHASFDLSHVT